MVKTLNQHWEDVNWINSSLWVLVGQSHFFCVHLLISATMGIRLPCLSREFGIVVDIFIVIEYLKVIGHKHKHSNCVYVCTTTYLDYPVITPTTILAQTTAFFQIFITKIYWWVSEVNNPVENKPLAKLVT